MRPWLYAALVKGAAWLAPRHLRDRWREEWLAELAAVPDARLSRVLGAPWDALAARWTSPAPPRARERHAWRFGWRADLVHALRTLRRSPAHVGLVIACLGLAAAGCLGVFSIVNSLLYGEEPGIQDRRSLVRVYLSHALAQGTESVGGGQIVSADRLSRDDFSLLLDHGPALTGLAAEGAFDMTVATAAGPISVAGAFVSGRYFDVLGSAAMMGRPIEERDDRPDAAPVVVVSDYFWRTHLGQRPDVVSASLVVGGRHATIVGVAQPRFAGIQPLDLDQSPADGIQLWLPLELSRGWPGVPAAGTPWLNGFGRLAPGCTRADAKTQLDVGARRIELASPATRPRAAIVIRPQGFGASDAPATLLLVVGLFLSVPLSVLAIACANVANLQLARATDRMRELAIRLSLGASRLQLLRLLVLESLTLGILASAAGVLGAVGGLRLIAGSLPLIIPFDWHVAAFASLLTAGMIVLTGLVPAWAVARRAAAGGLRSAAAPAGRSHVRLRNGLVVIQVALSVALLFMGALFSRSLQSLNHGIAPIAEQLLVAELELSRSVGYTPAEAGRLVDEMTSRLARNPHIVAAGFADFLPSGGAVTMSTAAGPNRAESINGGYVAPGWFAAVDAHVLVGRLLAGADAGAPVAVVNATLAARLATSGDVVGRRLLVRHVGQPDSRGVSIGSLDVGDPAVPVDVIGVIADPVAYPDGHTVPAMYLPMPVRAPTDLVLIVRSPVAGAAVADLRSTLASFDARIPIRAADTIADRIRHEISPVRYIALSVDAFGSAALLLALLGLYAVLGYVVLLRRREIGLRVALGARPREVGALVVRQAFRLVATGGALGLLGVLPLAYLLRSALFGISPVDPLALLPTLALLGAVAVLAAGVPAARAARIDPVRALREE